MKALARKMKCKGLLVLPATMKVAYLGVNMVLRCDVPGKRRAPMNPTGNQGSFILARVVFPHSTQTLVPTVTKESLVVRTKSAGAAVE